MSFMQYGFSFLFQHLTAAAAAWIGPLIADNILNLSGAQAAGRQGQAGIPTQIAGL